MPDQVPVLLPLPRRVHWGAGQSEITGELPLVLLARAQDLLPAALRLQAVLEHRLGIAAPVSASAAGLADVPHVAVDPAAPGVAHPQGYTLDIAGGRVALQAATPEGAAYGLATLKQILLGAGRRLPAVQIADHPDFVRRGVMLDISRGKVPTMATLFGLVDLLADLKLNEFQLYTEHTFAYRNHRVVWQDYSPMTGAQVLELDRYCRERGIDLVPNQNSFGHLTPWLVHAPYRHLAEHPGGWTTPWGTTYPDPFSLCPVEPAVIPFLAELYAELLPHFSSPYFNVGCDETWDVGQGRSRAAVAERGEHRVYLEMLRKIHGLVQARGRIMQFWGDIITRAPELIPELPAGVVALEWGYEAGHPFDSHGARFAAAGIPFYVCPGTSTWNSLVGRTDNMVANIREAAGSGRRHGALGLLVTIWGDRGHQDYQPAAYPGIALGAALGWAVAANREADVRPFLNRLVFADRAEQIGDLLLDLGNVYQAVGRTPHNASVLGAILTLPADQARHTLDGVTAADLDRAAGRVRELAPALGRLALTAPDGALVHGELANAVQMLLHACAYGQLLLAVQAGARPAAAAVQALARDLDQIMVRHRELWLARNRIGGLEEMSLAPLRRIAAWYRELA